MRRLVYFAAVLLTAVCAVAEPKTVTWVGGGTTARWSDASNWKDGILPAAGDSAVIPDGTVASASHYEESKGGDLTVVNSLASIRLDGPTASLEVDCDNDSQGSTGCFRFDPAVTGNGLFVVKNGASGDRYLECRSDNRDFKGVFVVSNARFKAHSVWSLGTNGCPVRLFARNGNNGFAYGCSGVFSNDFTVAGCSGSSNYPEIITDSDSVVVTNLGSVTVNKVTNGSVSIGGKYHTILGGVYNKAGSNQGVRFKGDVHVGGVGTFGIMSISSGSSLQSLYLDGPMQLEGTTCGIYCQDSGNAYASGPYFAGKISAHVSAKDVGMHIDLGGFDQVVSEFSYRTPSTGVTDVNNFEITSERKAKLGVGKIPSDQTFGGNLTGKVSFEIRSEAANASTFRVISTGNTMRGDLIANNGKIWLYPTARFPNVKCLYGRCSSKYKTDKSEPDGILPTFQIDTDAINPGRVNVDIGGTHMRFKVTEGVQLKARTFKIDGVYLKAGVYGGAAAREAHPELVDADHVLTDLTGTGTVKVSADGPSGMAFIIR